MGLLIGVLAFAGGGRFGGEFGLGDALVFDEQNGRLELVLATPRSRLSVILGRFAALATATWRRRPWG